jgi:acetyltransferase-like isoleucine patch superfamily enzyme
MMDSQLPAPRRVAAYVATRPLTADSAEEYAQAAALRAAQMPDALLALWDQHVAGSSADAATMRRVVWRALAGKLGDSAHIGRFVCFAHLDRFQFGSGLHVGDQAILQSRHDGRCVVGDRVWIGPQVFIDARDLVIGNCVGIGPGARLLGSIHTGLPLDVPVIATELEIRPTRIGDGADIGVGAIVLPGVNIGPGAIVGAGAVVTSDVRANTIVAGVPARELCSRRDR